MSAYQRVLRLARAQVAAAARRDLETAVRVVEMREAVLAGAAAATREDAAAIRETLRLDGETAALFRGEMRLIREALAAGARGQAALAGYRQAAQPAALFLDSDQ